MDETVNSTDTSATTETEPAVATGVSGSASDAGITAAQVGYRIRALQSTGFALGLTMTDLTAVCHLLDCHPLQVIQAANVSYDPEQAGSSAW